MCSSSNGYEMSEMNKMIMNENSSSENPPYRQARPTTPIMDDRLKQKFQKELIKRSDSLEDVLNFNFEDHKLQSTNQPIEKH
jgi:hypothetical protein